MCVSKECSHIIGLWMDYDNTELVTFHELVEHIKENNRIYYNFSNKFKDIEIFSSLISELNLQDYFDKRKSTNFTLFSYCPECGEKIDHKKLKELCKSIKI